MIFELSIFQALLFKKKNSVKFTPSMKVREQNDSTLENEPSQWSLSWLLIKSAIPTLIQTITQTAVLSSAIYFISLKNDPKLLGSFGLASTIYVITFYSIMLALNAGLATLGAQAHGAKNPTLLGLYYKKGLLIGLLILCPLTIICLFSSKILILCRFDEDVSRYSQKVLMVTIPSALGMVFFDVSKNYLMAQKSFVLQLSSKYS
mgnify:FL=1